MCDLSVVLFPTECLRLGYSLKRFGCSLDKSSEATALAELSLPQNSKGMVLKTRLGTYGDILPENPKKPVSPSTIISRWAFN